VARFARVGALALACGLAACSSVGTSAHDTELGVFAGPDLVNPLRGQYENLLTPLFPQSDSMQPDAPSWPGTSDVSARIDWRSVQPRDPRTLPPDATDDQKFDFSMLDQAIEAAARDGHRLGFRITSFNSCCETSYPNNVDVAVPDWLLNVDGATHGYVHDGVTYVIPDWNSPAYLSYFTDLLAALGRRYDRDERVALFEFSGYGDFSENHVAFMRDTLGIPGPDPDDTEASLGYYSQFQDQFITKQSIETLVTATLAAFPNTQLVTAMGNPEIVKQLFRDNALLAGRRKPVGIRGDGLGVYRPIPVWAEQRDSHYVQVADPIVHVVINRYRIAPIITEWIPSIPQGTTTGDYYQKGLRDVVDVHVSMTSSTGFPAQVSGTSMSADDFETWSRANKFSGYRYAVAEVAAPQRQGPDGTLEFRMRWTNFGVAPTYEQWVPQFDVVSASGTVVQTLSGSIDLHGLVAAQQLRSPTDLPAAQSTETTVVAKGLPPGKYSIGVRVVWREHKPDATHVVDYPPMMLAQQGRDGNGRYPLGDFTVV
jgi:hypothetical protein